jgi:hypothetical protein
LPEWYAFGCPKDNDSGGIRKKRLGVVWIGLSKKHFVKATRSYLQLRRFGLLVMLERPADRPSLAWPPVVDLLSTTLRALFSSLPGLSRCSFRQDRVACRPPW